MKRSTTLVSVMMATGLVLTGCGASGDTADANGCSPVNLRLSHQWPEPTGEGGDFRSVLAQDFADGVSEETAGQVKIQVFPNSTLSKSTEQFDAVASKAIDLSVLPLDYASGRVPEWSITLMPGLVRSHEQAQAWQTSPIGDALMENMESNGAHLLTWVWNAGAIGAKDSPIVTPSDVKPGMTMRAAGSYVEHMLEDAGAGISSLPSNELYTAMQTGVLDAAITSAGSFASYNLQEQVKSYTSPSENTFWFMFEPLLIGTAQYEALCPTQQEALDKVGADLQEFAYSASEKDDARVDTVFSDAGVEVVQMDDAAFDEWLKLAEVQWKDYADNVEGGAELLDLAKQVHQ